MFQISRAHDCGSNSAIVAPTMLMTITTRKVHTVDCTVAEKDTAAAAKAAVGRPKAAVGRQKAARRLRLAAAAEPRPPICLKFNSLAHDRLTRLLSRTHAQGINYMYSVCLCHGPHDMHRDLALGKK